jgi:transcriptional regulator with XRE-family HTH domain
MPDREQQLVDAAMRYQRLLGSATPPSIPEFVATEAPDLREELAEYLELILAVEQPREPIVLSAEEQALADRAGQRASQRFAQRMGAVAPAARSLTALRNERKQTLGALARRIDLPVDLLARIERGAVAAGTIPARLVTALAAALERAEAEIQAALAMPQAAAGAVRLSAEDGVEPVAESVVSFAEALEASTATDAQKAAWA